MTKYVKKSDVLELLSLPKDLIAEYESRRRVANGKSNIYGYSGLC